VTPVATSTPDAALMISPGAWARVGVHEAEHDEVDVTGVHEAGATQPSRAGDAGVLGDPLRGGVPRRGAPRPARIPARGSLAATGS